MDVFPCVVDNRNIFWVTSMIYCFVRRCCIVAVAPLPTTHPKLKLATGMSAWQRPLAVQHYMKIHDSTFRRSYVAQWQSVWPRNMRSSVRITDKPMVLKVRRKIGRSWSCDQCHVWSGVLGAGWKIGVKRRLTRYLICTCRSFSVDSCVRKHAKVYGENLQPCFNIVYCVPMSSASQSQQWGMSLWGCCCCFHRKCQE